jgi:hypothetical protein
MAKGSNWQYALIATCKDDTIKVLGENVKITKEEVAVAIVVLDLVICFVFWFGLLAMKPLEDAIDTEIDASIIKPEDFTVVVKQVPYLDKYEELRPIYWAWAENILEQEMTRENNIRVKPAEQQVDRYQDFVLNINFGLGNYGHLSYYTQMGYFLTEKKHIEKQIKKYD